jgi:peroxiredoxin
MEKEPLTLRGHTGRVDWLALSDDGQRLYSQSSDTKIKVWDMAAGKEILTPTLGGQGMTSLPLLADGRQLYSGSGSHTIKVWDLQTGKETRTLRGHTAGRVTCLALSLDGMRLYSGSDDSDRIRVWDLQTGRETVSLRGHTGRVTSLALSGDGRRLFSGSYDQTIKVWDLEAETESLTLRGHTDEVVSLALSADGRWLCSQGGYKDRTIMVWPLGTDSAVSPVGLAGQDSAAASVADAPATSSSGMAPDFTAKGVDGKDYSLKGALKDAKGVVVCFTCNNCPVAVAYEDRFIDFAKKYNETGIKFLAINVNTTEDLERMKVRAEEKSFNFPYAYEATGDAARAYGAKVTPHIFLVDATGKIVYRGAFDDNQNNPTKHYLLTRPTQCSLAEFTRRTAPNHLAVESSLELNSRPVWSNIGRRRKRVRTH